MITAQIARRSATENQEEFGRTLAIGQRAARSRREAFVGVDRKPDSVDIEATKRVGGESWKNLKEYLLYRRHVFAYDRAAQQSECGGTWLDIGCGMGHSLVRLAKSAERILAIDLAWTSLRGLPETPKLDKTRADASQLPLPDASIDYVVCFQVVEHLETELAIRILREIRRVLKPGGVGYVTTPNARWRLLPGQAPTNPYHLIEYRPDEIVDFCARAAIDRECIKGVIGLNGAQIVELARVTKNPFLVWGPHSRLAWSQWRTLPAPTGSTSGTSSGATCRPRGGSRKRMVLSLR